MRSGACSCAFVQPQILLVLVWYFGCLSAAVFGASRLGFWEWSLWKPTGVWLVLSGFGLLFRYDDAIKQRGFGWRVSVRTVALVEVVSFVADLASFPLLVEVPAQALAFIAALMSAWGWRQPRARASRQARELVSRDLRRGGAVGGDSAHSDRLGRH